MNKLAALAFYISLQAVVAQGLEVSSALGFALPKGQMAHNMKGSLGANLGVAYAPGSGPFAWVTTLSANIYGSDKTRQNYTLDDGSTAPMDVRVANNYYQITVGGRYLLKSGRLQPFVEAQAGVSIFHTSLNIYDPDDFDHCEPIERNVLQRDATPVVLIGGGLRYDVNQNRPGSMWVTLNTNWQSGGRINYMNVDAPAHSTSTKTSDVYVKFLNTQTQVVHEHHVGNVYTSLLSMMDVKVGFAIRVGR